MTGLEPGRQTNNALADPGPDAQYAFRGECYFSAWEEEKTIHSNFYKY
jgi:hypothetical protein